MKTGIVIELNGPATIQEEEALYGGGDARIVRVEGGRDNRHRDIPGFGGQIPSADIS